MSVGTRLFNHHLETLIVQQPKERRAQIEFLDVEVVVERLQQKVAELPVREDMPNHRLTVTICIAGVLEDVTDLHSLIQQANQALRADKHGGRNRGVMSQ